MKKNSSILIILLSVFVLVVASIVVYAAGTSTIPPPIPDKPSNPVPKDDQTNKQKDCESVSELKSRIKCRLENDKGDKSPVDYDKRVPEACRVLKNPTSCIALYKKAQENKCYDFNGKDKDKCFKTILDFKKAKLSDESLENRTQKARQYLILLLYDLEERTENKYKSGSISSDNASGIISLIEGIKQDVLNNKSKSEIVSQLNLLKTKIKGADIK